MVRFAVESPTGHAKVVLKNGKLVAATSNDSSSDIFRVNFYSDYGALLFSTADVLHYSLLYEGVQYPFFSISVVDVDDLKIKFRTSSESLKIEQEGDLLFVRNGKFFVLKLLPSYVIFRLFAFPLAPKEQPQYWFSFYEIVLPISICWYCNGQFTFKFKRCEHACLYCWEG
jgi:hypothetical protein